jgi:hypothetical protein
MIVAGAPGSGGSMVAETAGLPVNNPAAQPDIEAQDFSLVLGGPLYRLLLRSHLSDDLLGHVRARVLVLASIAWVPLLVLTALNGQLWDGSVTVPFLRDVDVHIRFLVALPLLIVAELIVHERLRLLVKTFRARNLIPEDSIARFDAALASAYRLRNSVVAEIALVVVVYVVGVSVIWRHYLLLTTATWYATPGVDGSTLTKAGFWYSYVSLPIFQFLLCRWYFRFFIWGRALWQISRIKLSLIPTHPDRAGGLGFLSGTPFAFAPILLAHGVLLSSALANRILHLGEKLTDFTVLIAALVGWLLVLVVGPLLVFFPQLARAKRTGLREYGTLAQTYVRDFDGKWLRGRASDQGLLGTGDIQSLADLDASLEIIRSMRALPISKQALIQLVVIALAPLAPLLLTIMPMKDLAKMLVGVIL